MKKKIISSGIIALSALAFSASSVFAHVTVKPAEVETAAFQTFTTSVPNEKDTEVTGIRLVIPSGLKEVTPSVKPGWTITTKKDGDEVTEISWTGGAIPAERRDDFSFSAQAPSEETTLTWKAYQSYSDGTVVSWDQQPSGGEEAESETAGPYSETKVVSELSSNQADDQESGLEQYTTWVAYGALLLAVVALALNMRGMSKQK